MILAANVCVAEQTEQQEYDQAVSFMMSCEFSKSRAHLEALLNLATERQTLPKWREKADMLKTQLRVRQDTWAEAEKKLKIAEDHLDNGKIDQSYVIASQVMEQFSKINHIDGTKRAENLMELARLEADKRHYRESGAVETQPGSYGFDLPFWFFLLVAVLLIVGFIIRAMSAIPTSGSVRMEGQLVSGVEKADDELPDGSVDEDAFQESLGEAK